MPCRSTPKEEAQELAFEALEAETEEQAWKLAKRALAKDPDCVDALVVLTGLEADSPKKAIEGLQKAVAAGERSLGARFFKENEGTFLGNRGDAPLHAGAAAIGRSVARSWMPEQDAISHYAAMLVLNPNDNQGVRYPLLGAYLTIGDLVSARALLKEFEGDAMATFAWGEALERALSGDYEGASRSFENRTQEESLCRTLLDGSERVAKIPARVVRVG